MKAIYTIEVELVEGLTHNEAILAMQEALWSNEDFQNATTKNADIRLIILPEQRTYSHQLVITL